MSKFFDLEEGWSTLVFLLGALLAAGWVLAATRWADGLDVVPLVAAGGLISGLFLAWSVFRGRTCHFFSLVYGLTWIGFLLGRGLPGTLTWGERITDLAARFFYWVRQAVTGGTGRDPMVFVLLLAGLFWLLGYSAAWNTYRHMRAWGAVLPPGLVVLISVYYYYGAAPLMRYLALYLFFALLYVARSHAFQLEQRWQEERVAYDPVMRFDFVRAGLVMTVIVLALAWTLPGAEAVPRLTAMWRHISEPWRTVQEEWQRLFSGLRAGVVGVVEPYGPALSLGGPRELRDVILMDVAAPRTGRYYWRAAVYSYYQGNRWEAVEKERIILIPGRQPPGMARDELRHTVVQTVTTYASGHHILVGASQLVAVSLDAEAYINRAEDAPLEFIRIFSILSFKADDQYVVTSEVSNADLQSLREAGTGYPEWVRERYLQLPPLLPERVRLLAEEITANATNPYDEAAAIERYLRDNVAYDLQPPDRPEGRDYVDFMLFDSKRDYCSGYATAMAVLARSVGIPARLVVGYAQGEYDAERGVFRVQEKNSHTWVEVYFPRYGWIEFEPTASESPIVRPAGTEGPLGDSLSEDSLREEMEALRRRGGLAGEPDESLTWDIEPLAAPGSRAWRWWLAGGLAVAILAGAGWWAAENWGLRRLPAVEQAYARLLRFGRWLGRPLRPSDTPFEWMDGVNALVPEARDPIGRIVGLYVQSRFARGTAADPQAQTAWREARPAMWRTWLRRLVPISAHSFDRPKAILRRLVATFPKGSELSGRDRR